MRFGIISFGRRAYHHGGEFIPTLDEDLSSQFKNGYLTKPLLLLLKSKNNPKNFPEVDQVVSRICR
jgi:hypothetical protein